MNQQDVKSRTVVQRAECAIKCKHHEEYKSISLKEEAEQHINSFITFSLKESSISASLPFVSDLKRLANNKDKAMKVYNQQLRKLNQPSNVKDKQDIESEAKLHRLGYIEYLSNLPSDLQDYLPMACSMEGKLTEHYMSSMMCPNLLHQAIVYLLVKGRNNLNKLQEVVIH